MEPWIEQESAGCAFADERLGKRFQCLLEQMAAGMGRPLPLACGDWAATKAAYRFLDNNRVWAKRRSYSSGERPLDTGPEVIGLSRFSAFVIRPIEELADRTGARCEGPPSG